MKAKTQKTMSIYEKLLKRRGYRRIAGVDESGRGPLAGPVVAAACIIEDGVFLRGIKDCKQLLSEKRQEVFNKLVKNPKVFLGIGIVTHERIDEINILQASFVAMQDAVKQLPHAPDFIIVDGKLIPHFSIPSEAIIKGDARSVSIAAASIIAKITRDQIMTEYDKEWPQYGFAQHKGYGTKKHLEALREHGPSPIHRHSFDPVRSLSLSQ